MFFNRHKIARRLGRINRRGDFFAPHRLDFAWEGSGGNPYNRKEKRMSRAAKVRLIVAFGLLSVSMLTILFHPFFAIQREHIRVDGIRRIQEEEFLNAVEGILHTRRAVIFPSSAYVLIREKELEEILRERFSLTAVSVEKTFPHSLHITIEEMLSSMIYDTGTQLAMVGENGRIMELLRPMQNDNWELATSTLAQSTSTPYTPNIKKIRNAFGDYPILYDAREKTLSVDTAVLTEETARGILEWVKVIEKQQSNFTLAFITIEHDLGDATLTTGEGWRLHVRVREDVPDQAKKLQTVLLQMTDAERQALQYVDLRYRDRVFWQ